MNKCSGAVCENDELIEKLEVERNEYKQLLINISEEQYGKAELPCLCLYVLNKWESNK